MGACMSSGGGDVTEADKARHKEVEKHLKEEKIRQQNLIKVLLLGSGDSGKSTILKQMRLIHSMPFTSSEVESYRQLVYDNITRGLKYMLDAMEDMELKVSVDNEEHLVAVENARDIRDGEPFPMELYEPLKALWGDTAVQLAWQRGNEAAIPENLLYFFSALDRLFDIAYKPTEQDIVQSRARTIGITETMFHNVNNHEMLMVDVGGQKSERRKWIHCFQDVTAILFLVSLSGYDQCLVEDKDANQMQDAMTIWDSICHSQWFRQTAIILFLNKNDLFENKIPTSDVCNFFPDFEGPTGDVKAARDYFKRRFQKLALKAGRSKEREIYIHITTATDTDLLRAVMKAVEGTSFRFIVFPVACRSDGLFAQSECLLSQVTPFRQICPFYSLSASSTLGACTQRAS
ncbi:guanine nucleotide-binding protein alpha-2 subunit [Fistulina hepatica ATCC 64428]|uniref:Guanine nucleotide-binding protein alpha-2 subunit n=1 Tax=Fistulina hepatica ATCC 64428 TaxID=1128425 RepID=A0A0D7AFY3_9AGAR|nr:guanine nucleotide-binding protein alpha-2 subunit [Fistulina hepatica ATCC 64428]